MNISADKKCHHYITIEAPEILQKIQFDVIVFAFWLSKICFQRKAFSLEEKCSMW